MQIEYKREMNHSYLVLGAEEELQIHSYEVKMMVNNTPKGLLPCSVRYINGDPLFYYEVTSKQNVKALFETKKFTGKDLKKIFHALADVMDEMERYLLDIDTLLLYPEYIYMDIEEQEVDFCCFPAGKGTGGGLLGLTEYILPRIDHEDHEAVILGYGIYSESMEPAVTSEQIRKELNKASGHEEKKERRKTGIREPVQTDPEAEEKRLAAMESFFEEEEEKGRPEISMTGIIFSLFLAAVCIFLLLHYEFLTPFRLLAGLGILLPAGLAGFAVLRYRRREKFTKRTEDTEEEQKEEQEEEPVFRIPYEEEYECGPTVLLAESGEEKKNRFLTWEEEGRTKEYCLKKETVLIGKLRSVTDICLKDPSVSRIHIKIQKEKDRYYITDLNSKNGTYLNGELAEPEHRYLMKENDRIKVGNTDFSFCFKSL